jgi:putative flippase GtrA
VSAHGLRVQLAASGHWTWLTRARLLAQGLFVVDEPRPEQFRLAARLAGRGSLARNATAAALATGTDFAVVVALVSLGSLALPTATFLGCAVGAVVNFLVNRLWVFGSTMSYGRQIVRYGVVSGASAGLNAGLVALLLRLWQGPYPLVWTAGRILVFLFWNYPLQRWYVFARGNNDRARQAGRTARR